MTASRDVTAERLAAVTSRRWTADQLRAAADGADELDALVSDLVACSDVELGAVARVLNDDAGDPMVMQLRERLREVEAQLAVAVQRAERAERSLKTEGDAQKREREWLKFISWRCAGMGADYARQALYSDLWPPKGAPQS